MVSIRSDWLYAIEPIAYLGRSQPISADLGRSRRSRPISVDLGQSRPISADLSARGGGAGPQAGGLLAHRALVRVPRRLVVVRVRDQPGTHAEDGQRVDLEVRVPVRRLRDGSEKGARVGGGVEARQYGAARGGVARSSASRTAISAEFSSLTSRYSTMPSLTKSANSRLPAASSSMCLRGGERVTAARRGGRRLYAAEPRGDVGRCGEMWGGMGRYGCEPLLEEGARKCLGSV
jgi:hypothetical protein